MNHRRLVGIDLGLGYSTFKAEAGAQKETWTGLGLDIGLPLVCKKFDRVNFILRPGFQYGTLDQGFWPDGLYTAPTDEALRYDIEVTKKLGFNMARKHVKVEPARWYYWCDRLGLLVWQDMPNGGPNVKWEPRGRFDGTNLQHHRRRIDLSRVHHGGDPGCERPDERSPLP